VLCSQTVAVAPLLAFQATPDKATLAKPAPALDPNEPYRAQRKNPVTYQVDLSAVVTPPYHCKSLKIWMPIPQSDFGQEVSQSEVTTFPLEVKPTLHTENVFGNRFAFVEFKNPHGAQIIRHRFTIKVWDLHWNLDAAKITAVDAWPRSFDRYRRGEEQAVVVDGRFEDLIQKIVPRRTNPLADMAQVMTWVNDKFTYDHVDASLQASAVHALTRQHGHCSDYHGFCASLGRAMGYPTRVTYGINPLPKNSPSHCKLEAFLPPYGWVSFDVSETQRLVGAIRGDTSLGDLKKKELVERAQGRLLSGFRDNTWFVQTRGTDYELSPPAARRAAVVRTIYAEADGVALPEPDPANKDQREFSWMTVHKYVADREVPYPFKDWRTLEPAGD
jgi:transglutaminase-like putative cysteine protease